MFSSAGHDATNFILKLGDYFNTSNVRNMRGMFMSIGSKSQTNFNLDLSAGDFNKVNDYSYMFNGISSNATILVKDSTVQDWIIGKNIFWETNFSTTNVLIK